MNVQHDWRVFDNGKIHNPGDPKCASCSDATGVRSPELHMDILHSCVGLVHFEELATGRNSWEVRSKCDVCGGTIDG